MTTRRRLHALFPVPVLSLALLVLPLSYDGGTTNSAAEAAYKALPPKPAGDAGRGAAGVERSALALAAWLHVLPTGPGTDAICPTDALRVSWTEPPASAQWGGYVAPLGPAPTDSTAAVNGIVVCATSTYGYLGFQARYADGRWDVVAVPVLDGDEPSAPDTSPSPAPAPSRPAPATPPGITASFDGRTFGAAIEDPAAYEPQRTCDSTPKVGAVALKNLLLKSYPGSRSLGIGTACDGTVSEHHEGRAFDWGVRVTVPSEKAMAQDFIAKALATDQYGNQFALARRMGIMYLIWDQHIWSTYRASEGWREYHGASPHTDHIHISMSWAGALGRTSFWSGNVAQVLAAQNPGGGGSGKVPAASAAPKSPPKRRTVTVPTQPISHDDPQARADADARRRAWEQARQQARQEAEARRRQWESTTTTTTDPPSSTTSTTWPHRTRTTAPPTSTTTSTTWRPRPTTTTTSTSTSTTSTTSAPRRRRSPTTSTTTTTVRSSTTTSSTSTSTSSTTSTTAAGATH